MAGLSSDSLDSVSKLTGLEGSGNAHSTPMFYKGLMQVIPVLVRTITNVRYEGLERIPDKGVFQIQFYRSDPNSTVKKFYT